MRKSFTMISLLLVAVVVSAKQVDEQTAVRAAASFAATISPLRSLQDLTLVYTGGTGNGALRSDAIPLFYVYTIGQDNGFVMVAGDDRALPILAYADRGTFRTDDMPANLKNWLAFYEKEISHSITNGLKASAETTDAWRNLLSGSLRAASVQQLFETVLWDQDTPYNLHCPRDGAYLTYTGCVATAMAIIMKHHEWPKQGRGTVEYVSETLKKSIKLTLNDEYAWRTMTEKYTYIGDLHNVPNWTAEQANAVARLMYHCAVVSQSDFTRDWTAAYPHIAVAGMVDHFNYDAGAYLVYRNLYTANEWNVLMQKELNEGRPIFYGGLEGRSGEGHQFVLDGYDSDNYYHVNWGWSGVCNGYYLLSSLDPQSDGMGLNFPGIGYSYEQSAGIGLQKPVEGSLSRYEFFHMKNDSIEGLLASVDSIRANEEFTLKIGPFADYGGQDFEGYVGVFLVDTLGKVKECLTERESLKVSVPGESAIGDLEGDTYTILSMIDKGDKVRLLFSVDSVSWMKVRGMPGVVIELPVYKSGTVGNEPADCLSGIGLLSTTFDSEVTLRVKEPVGLQQVLFHDMGGRLVKQFRLSRDDAQVTLSVADMQPGIYILTVRTAEGDRQFKVRKR